MRLVTYRTILTDLIKIDLLKGKKVRRKEPIGLPFEFGGTELVVQCNPKTRQFRSTPSSLYG